MVVMKNILFFNMWEFYKTNTKIKKKSKQLFFTLIKNYYLVLQNHKNLILLNPEDNINMYYSKLSSVNLLFNRKMDKWFIYKLISNLD